MHLVMISPLPIEEMRALAVHDFSKVPQFKISSKQLPTDVTSAQQRGHMIFIKPVKDIKQLSLNWEVPTVFAEDISRNAPGLVAHVLGQEGEGSLTQALKNEKIAEGVRVSCDRLSKQSLFFSVDILLTDYGLTQVDVATMRVYEAIARLKEEGFPAHLFDEIQTMAKLNYQFQSRDDAFHTIMAVSSDMPYEDLSTYPEKSQIPTQYDPTFIQSFVETLKAEKCVYFVLADPSKTGIPTDIKEKWMQAEYTIKPVSKSHLTAWNQAHPNEVIQLPGANPYLPKQLALVSAKAEVAQDQPLLLSSDEGSCVYYMKDSKYQVPEVAFLFGLKSPLINDKPSSAALADLYVRALSESLSADLSLASSAGLSIRLYIDELKLKMSLNGYSDKAPLLLNRVFASLKKVTPSKEEFEIPSIARLRLR